MNSFKSIIVAATIAVTGAIAPLTLATTSVSALDPAAQIRKGSNKAGGAGQSADLGDMVKTVVNILLFILGAIAVIMIVIGGIRYTLSNGDSSAVSSAKNTVLYAVIGLIVALLAYAIVNFVLDQF